MDSLDIIDQQKTTMRLGGARFSGLRALTQQLSRYVIPILAFVLHLSAPASARAVMGECGVYGWAVRRVTTERDTTCG